MKRSSIVIALSLILCAVAISRTRLGSRFADSIRIPSMKIPAVTAAEIDEPKIALLKPADFNKFKDSAKGKVLVVNFWATWCGPCVAEFPELIAIDKKYRDRGVKFVGISADEVADIQTKVIPFIKEQKPLFDILVQDTEDLEEMMAQIDKEWQGALPTTFIFNKEGLKAYTKYGVIDRDELTAAIEKAIK